MSPEIITLIIALAPYGTEVLVALIGALQYALAGGQRVESLAAVSAEILNGIITDHPDWDAATCGRYAADAIAVWHRDHPAATA